MNNDKDKGEKSKDKGNEGSTNCKPKKRNRVDNLVSLGDRSPEERKAISSKGGKVSQARARERKKMQYVTETLMNIRLRDDDAYRAVLARWSDGNDPDSQTVQAAIIAKQIDKAVTDGDTRAAEFLRDTVGDRPADKVDQATTVVIKGDAVDWGI